VTDEREGIASPEDFISNYDADGRSMRITDEMIDQAQPFEGHEEEFLDWPEALWKDPRKRIPCEDPEKNAYHIRYLADVMAATGGWVGDRLEPYREGPYVQSGSHRLRAAKFLAARGVRIKIPFRRSKDNDPHA
jgi:hypothetical protein